jgi:putative oxidoreductase
MKYVVLIGRVLFSAIFILTIMSHFKYETVIYAASQGVPLASFLVPLSGVIAITGGLSILLGYKAKIGAWLIVLFLIPVTYYMHAFWKIEEAMHAQIQMANFMKNLSLLGAALMISYFGSGPCSLDTMNSSNKPVL